MSEQVQAVQAPQSRREFASRLHESCLGCKLERSQFGTSRKVSENQKDQVADLFGADSDRVAANKKLLNKRHPAYLAVTSALNEARQIWQDMTVPYPEPGIRLIKRESVATFDARMQAVADKLSAAKDELERVYRDELIPDAQRKLGDLFNASDYPLEISGEFGLGWSFPSVDPPDYLRQISPRLYEQQQELVRARFEQALALTEQAFLDEFAGMIGHLVERLSPDASGKRKIFKDSAVDNLKDFFDRFRALNVGSHEQLNQLVDQAQQAIAGLDAKALRKDVTAQIAVRDSMSQLSQQLDALMIDRPKRKVTLGDDDEQSAAA